jgi:asparagine synthase (glutamine-hydrolysing)
MCGICGQLNYTSWTPVRESGVRAAAAALSHRGPDDEGFHFSGPVGLGFRRLSIIDLSGGHQPMSSDDASVWVVFNGEIYNFRELRKELESFGHAFRTRSDTETIIYGYRQWGEHVFEHLNGMFAIAIWDARLERLLVARDGMGMKPLYYTVEGGKLSFGSELRAVTQMASHRPELDPAALNLFIRHRFTPSPLTLFKNIRKLAPGSMLVAEKGRLQVSSWYKFEPTPFVPRKSLRDATAELASLYRAALERHLISDVPLGLFLSGGIDSSLLLSLMAERGGPWPTYTVGYGGAFADDELADAKRTARFFGSKHVELELSTDHFEHYLPRVVSSMEEPVATSSIVPMYAMSERARQDVKVALMGQGPDELFGGYKRHLGVHYGQLWRRCPPTLRRVVKSALSGFPRSETFRRGLYALDVDGRLERFRNVLSIVSPHQAEQLFRDGVLTNSNDIPQCWQELDAACTHTDELGAFQFIEMRSTLPDELLMYGDKLSMAHGLEVRLPYLDREVVEYAQRLDATLKVRFAKGKRVHRAVCAQLLPGSVMKRRKRGFASNVVDRWFRQSLSKKMESVLVDGSSLMYAYLNQRTVVDLLRRHQSGVEDNHKILFSLVVVEWWLRSHTPVDAYSARANS